MKIVQDNKSLDKLCKKLKKHKVIYLDTEFKRDKTYWPILCTLQFRLPRSSYLVDFIDGKDLDFTELTNILKSKNILKVMHSARQDIEVLYSHFKIITTPIFDTQLAYQLIYQVNSIGYTTMINNFYKTNLSKKYQLSDWTVRPLSKEQLLYAESDVKYLPKVFKKLNSNIDKLDLKDTLKKLHLGIQDIKDIYNPKKAFKRFKTKRINKIEMKKLKIFTAWRELKAQEKNIPRNWIISDKTIDLSLKGKLHDKTFKKKKKNNHNGIDEFKKFLKSQKFI